MPHVVGAERRKGQNEIRSNCKGQEGWKIISKDECHKLFPLMPPLQSKWRSAFSYLESGLTLWLALTMEAGEPDCVSWSRPLMATLTEHSMIANQPLQNAYHRSTTTSLCFQAPGSVLFCLKIHFPDKEAWVWSLNAEKPYGEGGDPVSWGTRYASKASLDIPSPSWVPN